MKTDFNKYCAEVMGYDYDIENVNSMSYNPYYKLYQLAVVVEELINLTGKSPIEDVFGNGASTWQIWSDFVVSTMPQGNTMIEKIAKALVECGYAKIDGKYKDRMQVGVLNKDKDTILWELCDPFADTIIGIHQAHALEDWLTTLNDDELFRVKSKQRFFNDSKGQHQLRLRRIEWCLEQIDWLK